MTKTPASCVVLMVAALLLAWGCDATQPGPIPEVPLVGFQEYPRVEMVGFTTAYVSWVPEDTTVESRVHLGPTGASAGSPVPVELEDSLWVAVPDGLNPDTEYALAVSLHRGGEKVGGSDAVVFRTRPAVEPPTDPGPLLEDVVARLTGHLPIRDGLRLRSRSDTTERRLAAAFLRERMGELGLPAEIHAYRFSFEGSAEVWEGRNVYAVVPATTPTDEWVLIGAHYDSVSGSPGAVDNATGAALALALGRAVRGLDYRRYNVMVALFDQEEQGVIGSYSFAGQLRSDGVVVRAMTSFDMLGWDGDGDRALELWASSSREQTLAYRLASREVSPAVPLHAVPGYAGSDHLFFPNSALLIEELGTDSTPHYHRPGDDYGTVDFGYLRSTAGVAFYALALFLAE